MPTKRYVKIVKSETFTAAIMYHNNLWEIKYENSNTDFSHSLFSRICFAIYKYKYNFVYIYRNIKECILHKI